MLQIVVDDLTGPEIADFLGEHLREMHLVTPAAESVHALDLGALRAPGITFWSVLDDGALVGCGALKLLDARHAELKSMRTDATRKRGGVASALLTHILAEARGMGVTRISLETGAEPFFHPAHRLYAKFGFTFCTPFADYAEDPNSVFMTLVL